MGNLNVPREEKAKGSPPGKAVLSKMVAEFDWVDETFGQAKSPPGAGGVAASSRPGWSQ